MDGVKIHFEVFARRTSKAGFTLELATEDRAKALAAAEEMMTGGKMVAVKVTKETMDIATGEFKAVTILSKGEAVSPKSKTVVEDTGPLCVSPADLYTAHARERIGRLLDGWLLRNRATPFELLHRPDLVEKLEASGVEIQHAVQKVAIPEAHAKGVSVHEIIRSFQKLVEQAIERVLKQHRQKVFPDLAAEGFAAAAVRLHDDSDGAFKFGVGVANALAGAETWNDKVDRLLDLADAAPTQPGPRAMAFAMIEQPLAEILGARAGLAAMLGSDLDLGGTLLALTRMAAPDAVDAIVKADPRIGRLTPALHGAAARLANWLGSAHFGEVRGALAKRVLQELTSPRRLRPGDPVGEIEAMRALAMLLTAAAGRLLQHDDILEAFSQRSQSLVTSEFVSDYLAKSAGAMEEIQALIRLAENVTGTANKRKAGQWLLANLAALKFERELRASPQTPAFKLIGLADLQGAICRVSLPPGDDCALCDKIGEVGGLIDKDVNFIATIVRSQTPVGQKVSALLRLATGQTGPTGPVAERARAEVLKLFKLPGTREALAGSPEQMAKLAPLIQALGLAA